MKLSITAILIMLFAATASAQNVALADLQQDLALMKREVGQLRLEVEQLRRENEILDRKLKTVQNSSVGSESVRTEVSAVKAEVATQNDALKREIVSLVRKDIEALADQTNKALDKLAKAIGSRPVAEVPVSFGDDYPKTGITYTVKSGDSLSKIARMNNSRIKWIQDANKIADPNRGLRVGETIFVPQQ